MNYTNDFSGIYPTNGFFRSAPEEAYLKKLNQRNQVTESQEMQRNQILDW